MTVSVFDSQLYGRLFTDDDAAALFNDRARVRAMLNVEAALARAEAESGLIPADAARRIVRVAETLDPDPALLAEITATSGAPVAALLNLLREAVGEDAAGYVHWGATSQDIVDTALVLGLRESTRLIEKRLLGLIRGLLELARDYRDAPMLARTRSQAAVPTSFGLKAAGWAAPLLRHRQRLEQLKPRLLVVQLGGAAGTRSAFGGVGEKVVSELARDLELGSTTVPWHAQRDALAELASWLSLVTGSVAKLGQDVVLLTQSEVGELHVGGGGSSTMPQKENPVAAELLVALARHNASLLGEMHHALVHTHERDGAAWSSEWIALPPMVVAAASALDRAARLVATLAVDTRRMADNLEAMNGLVLAEAAVFALAPHVTRPRAEKLVTDAIHRSRIDGEHLLDHLARMSDAPVLWHTLRDPAAQLATAREMVDHFLSADAGGYRT